MTMSTEFNESLSTFAGAVHERFASVLVGQPEDQLKTPVENLVKSLGRQLGHTLHTVTEATAENIGRPDMAVAVDGALVGHIELKKPGTGADPTRFTGHNAQQWRKFQLFKQIRDRIMNNSCKNCKHTSICLGGCPIIKEISPCSTQG